jgi:nucleoside-diphosphate-sugar epimerase
VYGSTSSVYGRFAVGGEDQPTQPVSPYGVTKLAAEHLCHAYSEAAGLPVVTLRFFSVYGPRQRPDMGYHRFVQAFLNRTPITLYGDGSQVRGNTFVGDCVAAVVAAADAPAGSLFNVGGGEATTTLGVIRKLERIFGYTVPVVRQDPRAGDQQETGADTTRLRSALGWKPLVGLDEGLTRQVEWQAARAGRLLTAAAAA